MKYLISGLFKLIKLNKLDLSFDFILNNKLDNKIRDIGIKYLGLALIKLINLVMLDLNLG